MWSSILDKFYIVRLRKDGCQATRKFWRLELLEPRNPLNSSDGGKQLMEEAKMPPVAVPRYEGSEGGPPAVVVTYHPILPNFKLITKRHLPTLHTSERLPKAFSLPPLIAFRRLRNLRNFLVQVTLTAKTYESPGNHPCGAA